MPGLIMFLPKGLCQVSHCVCVYVCLCSQGAGEEWSQSGPVQRGWTHSHASGEHTHMYTCNVPNQLMYLLTAS